MGHRLWCLGANMKPKPISSMQRGDLLGGELDLDAERLEQIGGPAAAVAERLPCLATAQPAPAAISAAVVEMLKVVGPPPVPAVSTRSSRSDVDMGGEAAHRPGQPDQLGDRLALGAQGDQESAGLDLPRPALHDLGERRRGVIGRQVGRLRRAASIARVRMSLGIVEARPRRRGS